MVPSTSLRLVMTSPISWSRSRQRAGERTGVSQQRNQRSALALEYLQQCPGEVVDLLRVERTKQRLESAEQQIQIESGRRLIDRNGSTRRKRLGGTGALEQFHVAIAHQVLVAHSRFGALHQRVLGVDVELDLGLVGVTDGHSGDRPDRNTGDADLVAGLESRDVREGGVKSVAAAEAHLTEDDRQSGEDDRHDDGENQQA